MGNEKSNEQLTYTIMFRYAEEVRRLVQSKPDSYIQEVVKLLLSFANSEDFIPFMLINKDVFFYFYMMCDMGKVTNKYLFIEILFPLLEELKKSKFEGKIWEANNVNKEDQKSMLSLYYSKNKDKISEKKDTTSKGSKPFEILKKMIKHKRDLLGNYLDRIVNVLFANEEIVQKNSKNQNIIDEAFSFFKGYFFELKISKNIDISKLVDYLIGLYPSVESIKEIYNITMFALLKAINEEEMKSILGINYENSK